MDVKNIKTSEVIMYQNNTKKHPEEQVEQIANSIREFGFKQPLVVDKDNVLIIGHGRLMAAQLLGLDEVPCILADDLTDDQIKALRIADNKLSEKAIWDNDALAEEIKAIGEAIDMTDFGFGEFELSILTNDFEPEPFDKEIEETYSANEDKLLAKRRVIITYEDETENLIKALLHLDEITKVVYDIRELK